MVSSYVLSESCNPMDCVAGQVPLSMRQEEWGGLSFPSPGDLSDPEIELRSPALQVGSLLSHQGCP